MKFIDEQSLQNHLKEAYPQSLASLFVALIPNIEEREAMMMRLASLMQHAKPHLEVKKVVPEDLESELASPSLFGHLPILVCNIENKIALPKVPSDTHLILGLTKAMPLPENAVLLDLSKEKPWDREKRIKAWIAKKTKGQIEGVALDLLLERVGYSWGLLEREVEKLQSYTNGEMITKRAVETLVHPSAQASTWQLAEGLIWDRKTIARLEVNDFPMFIGSLRYQLELGLALSMRPDTIREKYPKLRDRALTKYRSKQLPASYFEAGLKELFEAEWAFKSGTDAGLCLDRFQARLITR